MEEADQEEACQQDPEPGLRPQSKGELQEKITWLRGRQQWYQDLERQLKESGESQISLTDPDTRPCPDSRSMPVQRGTEVCYNVQMAVDSKHKLIVAHEVRSEVTDQNQLSGMALQAKQALAVERLEVAADTGYYDGHEVKRCEEAGITAYVAKAQTSVNVKRGLFTKEDFTYTPESDTYTCPAGETLTFRFEAVELGREIRYYALPVTVCRGCPQREQCTRNKGGRRITRWKHEHIIEEMQQRVRQRPEVLGQRQAVVEHPFGTMKRSMDAGYFLLKGRAKVGAEMSLTVLTYNLMRVVNLLGVTRLIEAVQAGATGLASGLFRGFLSLLQGLGDAFAGRISVRVPMPLRRRWASRHHVEFSHSLSDCSTMRSRRHGTPARQQMSGTFAVGALSGYRAGNHRRHPTHRATVPSTATIPCQRTPTIHQTANQAASAGQAARQAPARPNRWRNSPTLTSPRHDSAKPSV